jgi:drug/metabolite transporter (DMT)-like permease
MIAPLQHKGRAIACVLLAIALANMQDAVVKGVSGTIPAYETMIFRTVSAFPLLFGWLIYSGGLGQLFGKHVGALFMRSILLCTAYLAFVLSIAALPLATAVSIYFTMPFFVAGLSGYALGESVPLTRWIAIVVGFIGVIITTLWGENTGAEGHAFRLEPAVFFALYSAFGYAWAQMWGRTLSHRIEPAVIVNWQNATYCMTGVALALIVWMIGDIKANDKAIAFLTRPWAWPDQWQLVLLIIMGILSSAAAALFLLAYRYAEASFVAPFEYSAIIWATLNGIVFFNEIPNVMNILGTAIIIAAGLWMLWTDRKSHQTG